MPGFPADLFLNWSMLLAALEANSFTRTDQIAETAPALEAMDLLKRLAERMPASIDKMNPIAMAEHMTRNDETAYCAFAYSYGNYCRPHFNAKPLRYGNLVNLDDGRSLRSIVGGTGMAITRRCQDMETAIDFATFCSSAEIQSGLYTYAGGQPARREAWVDNELDAFNGRFFSGTLRTHEDCLLHPRYDGYVPLQEEAGRPLQDYLKGELSRDTTWEAINQRYRASLPEKGKIPSL
jgi:multiple sugar transport system substrate-binding protein